MAFVEDFAQRLNMGADSDLGYDEFAETDDDDEDVMVIGIDFGTT